MLSNKSYQSMSKEEIFHLSESLAATNPTTATASVPASSLPSLSSFTCHVRKTNTKSKDIALVKPNATNVVINVDCNNNNTVTAVLKKVTAAERVKASLLLRSKESNQPKPSNNNALLPSSSSTTATPKSSYEPSKSIPGFLPLIGMEKTPTGSPTSNITATEGTLCATTTAASATSASLLIPAAYPPANLHPSWSRVEALNGYRQRSDPYIDEIRPQTQPQQEQQDETTMRSALVSRRPPPQPNMPTTRRIRTSQTCHTPESIQKQCKYVMNVEVDIVTLMEVRWTGTAITHPPTTPPIPTSPERRKQGLGVS